MLYNYPIKCNVCGKEIDLKFQMDDCSFPFIFYCPNCSSRINGELTYRKEGHEFSVCNATKIPDEMECDYFIELSTFFLGEKIKTTKGLLYGKMTGTTPYMRTMDMVGLDKYDMLQKFKSFVSKKDEKWNDIYNSFLITSKNDVVLLSNKSLEKNKEVKQIVSKELKNFFNELLPLDIKNKIDKSENKLMGISKENIKEMKNIIGSEYFKYTFKKIMNLFDDFIKNMENYVPIIVLKKFNSLHKVDYEKYGITTVDYKDVKGFFQDSYELLLSCIVVPIMLNNIVHRAKCDRFNKFDISYENFNRLDKYLKIDYLDPKEYFNYNVEHDNIARNSVAHYDAEYNNISQLIIFWDRHRGKERSETMYLSEFVSMCIDNVYMVYYIYNLLNFIYDN